MDYDVPKVTPATNDMFGLLSHILHRANFRLGFFVLLLSIILYSDYVAEFLYSLNLANIEGQPTTQGYFMLHLTMAIAVVFLSIIL